MGTVLTQLLEFGVRVVMNRKIRVFRGIVDLAETQSGTCTVSDGLIVWVLGCPSTNNPTNGTLCEQRFPSPHLLNPVICVIGAPNSSDVMSLEVRIRKCCKWDGNSVKSNIEWDEETEWVHWILCAEGVPVVGVIARSWTSSLLMTTTLWEGVESIWVRVSYSLQVMLIQILPWNNLFIWKAGSGNPSRMKEFRKI